MKILITGAAGMLGTALLEKFSDSHAVIATDLHKGYGKEGVVWKRLDILNKPELVNFLEQEVPDVVIHCAAIVNVDECEINPSLAWGVHVEATANIAETISQWGARLIYVSSDSVFNGRQPVPYSEEDSPAPLNVYAKTKLEGETIALSRTTGLVLRTNIFGWSCLERISFAEWVLKGLIQGSKLTMFSDVFFTPLHVSQFSSLLIEAIKVNLSGIYHLAGGSVISKHDFAVRMANIFSLETKNVLTGSVESSHLKAQRPKNMALSSMKLVKAISQPVPSVDSGIALLKWQYDKGWLKAVKRRPLENGYKFWKENE